MFTTVVDNGMHSSASVLSFAEYKEQEAKSSLCAVNTEGALLEHTVLELRVNPPNVDVDNRTSDAHTIITVDSANRPGTLVEVVQCLTELNLAIKGTQISSDGGWFVDVFSVTELSGAKVTDEVKVDTIKKVLKIEYEREERTPENANGYGSLPVSKQLSTVFELGGEDKPGIMMEATNLLQRSGCDVRSLAAWTQNNQGAIVISATEDGHPIQDKTKIKKLKSQLLQLLASEQTKGIVDILKVKGLVHHERRLHRMLLRLVDVQWRQLQEQKDDDRSTDSICNGTSPSSSEEPSTSNPQVDITDWPRLSYWRVSISCNDRPKLFFDTLCTLADLDYDVYHASASSTDSAAFQDFYIRPRFGDIKFQSGKTEHLKYMLRASIQRRFPRGQKVFVHTSDTIGLLAKLCTVMYKSGIHVTRAKVQASQDAKICTHTFYVIDASGEPIEPSCVVSILSEVGGKLTPNLTEDRVPPRLELPEEQFCFAIPERTRGKGLGGRSSASSGSP